MQAPPGRGLFYFPPAPGGLEQDSC